MTYNMRHVPGKLTILLTVLAAITIVSHSSAQKYYVSAKDSVFFAGLTAQINKTYAPNPKLADSLAHIYFEKAKKLGDSDYCGRGATLVSCGYLALHNIAEAKKWHKTAMGYFREGKNDLWMGYANLNLGNQLNADYSFDEGMPYLLQSLKDFERAEDSNMIVSAYSSIAVAYHDFGNYQKGKQYALMAIDYMGNGKDIKPSYRWRAYTALAINYDDGKEWDKAIETHLKAIKYAGPEYLTYTYNDLGNTYRKKGDLPAAIRYLNLALSNKGTAQDYHLATVFGNIADVYRQRHDYVNAEKYIDSTLYYSQRSVSPEKLIDAYEFAYLLKNDNGDYKNAVKYLELHSRLKDSLLNAEKAKIVYRYQEQFEAERRQKRIEEQEFEISKRNYWLLIGLVFFALSAITAFFIYRSYRYRQERKLQKEIFRQQEIESKALFDGEQKERIRIARDLHDGVGQMLSLIKMNLSAADPENITVKKTSELVDKTIDEVRNVSHNLIPQELNFGIVRALEDIAEKVNASGETIMALDIPNEVETLKFEKQNELSIYRIVQEVVNNMIKHAGANRIDLSIRKNEQSIIIAISDNGRGMDESAVSNSKGIGWKNINARVHLLEGKINIRSERLSGTQIEITLPGNGEQP